MQQNPFLGLFTFRLVGFLWALEISSHHSGRYDSLTTASCRVPFGVSPAVSLATEAAGSLALGLGIPLIAENPTLANNYPAAASLAISGLVVAVVLCALPLSGGIFNPMLGSVLFGGCGGHTMVSTPQLRNESSLIFSLSPPLPDRACRSVLVWRDGRHGDRAAALPRREEEGLPATREQNQKVGVSGAPSPPLRPPFINCQRTQ